MRRLTLGLLGLAAAVPLAGCGDGAGIGGASPTMTVTATATATATDTAEPLPAETVTLAPETSSACDDLATTGSGLAFVVVEQPTAGAAVQSPFEVSGCANAFEAAYQWRLLDRAGATLSEGFGTASCGTGCVGTFEEQVDFDVDGVQVGSIQVFTTSAEDGSVQDLNSIPVLLTP